MTTIYVADCTMELGAKRLFAGVNLTLSAPKRYGLVGANGSGKSTLLKMISGELSSTKGSVTLPKGACVGQLRQDQFQYDDMRLIDVVLQGRPALWKALQNKEVLLNREDWDDAAGYQLAELEEEIARLDGYAAEGQAAGMLAGVGIATDRFEEPMRNLSGGYKLRVLLAQTLFESPDILLLDEPTNYLDILALSWLEHYLRLYYQGLLVVASHDRHFLNAVCTHILDIDFGAVRCYTGNYDHYLTQKESKGDQIVKERKQVQERIAEMQVFVERNRYKPSKARQAMSRQKMIDKLEVPELEFSSRQRPTFRFTQRRPSGQTVLRATDVCKQYGERDVLFGLDLEVERGEKVALIGRNGIGKSTLIKLLLGRIPLDEGTIEWGYETHKGYFAQDHRELLSGSVNVFDWTAEQVSDHTQMGKVRNLLGQALFSGDDVYKQVTDLSGGEAARLLLARLMLQQPNVLLLDEPTNHLDIEAIEQLEQALCAYDGTIFAVSHDREFLAKFANRILFLDTERLIDFRGDFEEFLSKHAEAWEQAT